MRSVWIKEYGKWDRGGYEQGGNRYFKAIWNGKEWEKDPNHWTDYAYNIDKSKSEIYESLDGIPGDGDMTKEEATKEEFGAASLSAEDFIDSDGNMLPMAEIVNTLMDKFPGSNKADIEALVAKEMPRFKKVSEEEKGFV